VASRRSRRHPAAANGGRLLVTLLALLVCASAAPPSLHGSDVLQARPRKAAASLSRYELRLLDHLNVVRAKYGRELLTAAPELTASAELHSARMVARGFFDHEAPGEGPFWRRIERFYPSKGYDYWAVGENLAYGSPSLDPGEVVHDWLASPTHRRSLVWAAWREVGLAVVHVQSAPGEYEGGPVTVVTADFGVRRR
jgi:uncharacterized protein YkwD